MSETILGTLAVKLRADIKDFQTNLDDSKKSLGDITSTAKVVGATASAAFAGIAGAVAGSLAALEESRQAELRLAAAIRGSGQAIDPGKIASYAAELQKLTIFDDDATIGAAAMLATFKLSEKQITDLLPKVQDLSAMFGIDLESATMAVGKAVAGNIVGLSRYGIVLSESEKAAFETADESTRLALVMEKLSQVAGGAAADLTNTTGGALKQLRAELGNIGEEVGKIFEGPVVAAIKALKDALGGVSEFVKNMSPEMKALALVAAGLGTAIAALAAAASAVGIALPIMNAGWLTFADRIGTVIKAIWGMKLALVEIVAIALSAIGIVGGISLAMDLIKNPEETRARLGIAPGQEVGVGEAIKLAFTGSMSEGVNLIIGPLKDAMSALGSAVMGAVPGMDKLGQSADDGAIDFAKMGNVMGTSLSAVGSAAKKAADSLYDFSGYDDATQKFMENELGTVFDEFGMGLKDKLVPAIVQTTEDEAKTGWNVFYTEASSWWTRLSESLPEVAAIGKNIAKTAIGGSSTASDVMQGASQGATTAGPWGAVIGIILALMKRAEQFKVYMEMLNDTFRPLIDVINQLMVAFKPLLSALKNVVQSSAYIAQSLGLLGPLFKVIGIVAGWLGDIINLTVEGIVGAYNWIVDKIAQFADWIGLGDVADSIRSWKVSMDEVLGPPEEGKGIAPALDDVTKAAEDMGDAAEDTASALAHAAYAANDLTASLTNVPQGFKVEKYRYDASQGNPMFERGGNMNVGTLNIQVSNPEELWQSLKRVASSDAYAVSGSTVMGLGFAVASRGA